MWLGWDLLFGLLVLLYFPIACTNFVLLLVLLVRGRWTVARTPCSAVASGRRVVVIVCTNGQNAEVVERICHRIRSYAIPVEIFVLREAVDPFPYSASTITVPAAYQTAHRSRNKMRALQYGIEYLHLRGYGRETFVCHLDDDSVVERGYLEHIFAMPEEAGQGSIRLRQFDHHLLSSLADMGRVFNCDTLCRHFNSLGTPMEVHGEGLVVRADVEFEIGWDFATYGAEDLMMGQSVVQRGYRFGFIPYHVFIAPPTTARDFYLQRRRWIYSILWSVRRIREIRAAVLYWLLYRYATSWTGFVGLLVLPLTFFSLVHLSVPGWLYALAGFNTVAYFAAYQYGAGRTKRAYMPLMLALQFGVAFYEGATLVYSALRPPDHLGFDVIRKV